MSKSKIESHIEGILEKIGVENKSLYSNLVDYCLSISLIPQKLYKKDIIAVDFIN